MKLIVMFLCFGSFLFTGNPWAAVAVFVLGMSMDEAKKAVAAPSQPEQTGAQKEHWQRNFGHNAVVDYSSFERRTTLNPPRDTTPFPLEQPRKSFFSF